MSRPKLKFSAIICIILGDTMFNPPSQKCPRCNSPMTGFSFRGGINWRCSRFPMCDGFKTTKTQKTSKQPTKK